MIKVFIGGSRKIFTLNEEVITRIKNILDQSGMVLVGDANGADKTVQRYLLEMAYKNVVVFCAGEECRNNLGNWETRNIVCESTKKDFNFFASKDKAMSKEADYGFMLWDGKSKGTINNVLNLLKAKKKTLLFHSKYKEFVSISKIDDLKQVLRSCDEPTKEKLINDLNLIELKTELRQKNLTYA